MVLKEITKKAGVLIDQTKTKIKEKKFTKKTIILISVIMAILVLLIAVLIVKSKPKQSGEKSYTTAYAQVGTITETIEQSGTVEPYERREITSLVKGEIIESNFEEGDYVEEGQTLYRIDDEDAQLDIEKATINLEETEEDIKNLYIYAPASGTLSDFKLKEGENASGGTIGYITDHDTIKTNIPFTSYDFDRIRVGDSVTVTSALYMTSLSGTVTHKYEGNLNSSLDGASVKNIEVTISNPGALSAGTTVAAVVSTSYGDVYSTGSGVLESSDKVSVSCDVQGSKVGSVKVKNGDKVRKGQLLAILENRSLYTTKKSNELNLRSSQKSLENYNITAPISGTIITKNRKSGDKIDNSNSSTVMMVIADMSKMKFTISVDELDIAKIQIDQKVVVNADAIENHTFEGRVSSVAAEGVSSGDGVTTYEVEIVIDEPGELKSGMNVNANIIINQATDVVYIPEEALMMTRGTSAMVLVKANGNKESKPKNKETQNSMPKDVQRKKPMGERPENMTKGGQPPAEGMQRMGMELPEGYELRNVETGVSDGRNVEIRSGLNEGDEIIYIASTATSTNGFMMGGRMPGGMGGRMPGGMGGGMSGGMRR